MYVIHGEKARGRERSLRLFLSLFFERCSVIEDAKQERTILFCAPNHFTKYRFGVTGEFDGRNGGR